MTQGELFDLELGKQFKEEGMDLAATNDADLLNVGRAIALDIAAKRGEVTADDVQEELLRRTGRNLRNAAGSLFRGGDFFFTGEFRQSRRTANHAHCYRVWRLFKP